MAENNIDLKIHHVTRVEGHGDIVLNVKNGTIEELRFDVVEAPRFFEFMLKGRSWDQTCHLTCRICGICSVAHTSASVRTTEDAFGIVPDDQVLLERKLLLHAEFIQSHILHIYFLVAPDLFGVDSVIPLAQTNPDVVKRAFKLKGLANWICEVLVGRHVHPCAMLVKGFAIPPTVEKLKAIRERIVDALPDLDATVDLLKSIELPDFERETEYISLHKDDEYALYDGMIYSSDTGECIPQRDYRNYVREFIVQNSTAKCAKHMRESYMVGALARFNNNYEQLHPKAKEAAGALELQPPCHKPYMITVAQLVETVHCCYDALDLIDALLARELKEDDLSVEPKAGNGVGIVEAPRGILIHDYTYDNEGICTAANCVIPTNQNVANIQQDFWKLVPEIIEQPKDKIAFGLETLVRAYDPCISCSTHLLRVRFTGEEE